MKIDYVRRCCLAQCRLTLRGNLKVFWPPLASPRSSASNLKYLNSFPRPQFSTWRWWRVFFIPLCFRVTFKDAQNIQILHFRNDHWTAVDHLPFYRASVTLLFMGQITTCYRPAPIVPLVLARYSLFLNWSLRRWLWVCLLSSLLDKPYAAPPVILHVATLERQQIIGK